MPAYLPVLPPLPPAVPVLGDEFDPLVVLLPPMPVVPVALLPVDKPLLLPLGDDMPEEDDVPPIEEPPIEPPAEPPPDPEPPAPPPAPPPPPPWAKAALLETANATARIIGVIFFMLSSLLSHMEDKRSLDTTFLR